MAGERILVVDDEPGVRGALQAILADEGFSVDCVASGEDGLAALEDDAFDAVLATNLKSNFYSSRAAARQMVSQGDGGSIINVASGTAMRGNRTFAYPTAKGGVISCVCGWPCPAPGRCLTTMFIASAASPSVTGAASGYPETR